MFDKIAVRFVEATERQFTIKRNTHIRNAGISYYKNKRFFDTKVFRYQLISLTMT